MSGSLGSVFGGSSHTTTSTQAPWGPQQSYLKDVFGQAQGLYNQGPFQGPFIGQASPYTAQGQQMLSDIGTGKIGPNVNNNPYLQSSIQDALGQASSAFAGQYGGPAGQNVNNSGYQEALARGLGAVATNAYSNAYGTEMNNLYNRAGALMQAGQSQEARSQAEALAAQQAYMSPWSNLANYHNAIGGNYGATMTQPYYTNPLASAMGMGMAGMGMYGMGQSFGMFGSGS